jgi:hypothetical protein
MINGEIGKIHFSVRIHENLGEDGCDLSQILVGQFMPRLQIPLYTY